MDFKQQGEEHGDGIGADKRRGSRARAVIQSYRKAGMFDSVSLFQGPMLLGKTRASVE